MATKKAKSAIVTPIDQRETFVSAAKSISEADGISMEEKLQTLYKIQQTDTKIDKIHLLRGELPLEVQDLEDEIEGLKTRCVNIHDEIKATEKTLADCKSRIDEAKALVEKYSAQQDNVKNNREFESLSKEIEYQTLEQEACAKKIKEANVIMAEKKALLTQTRDQVAGREEDLAAKKKELEVIITETAKDEEELQAQKDVLASKLDERMLAAYSRVRNNAKNHLAVVTIKRGACGGCFNKIPPQRQLDIAQSKKIIVCEYCGRILVNPHFEEEQED